MQPSVPARGAHYAVTTVKNVLNHPDSPVSDMKQVDDCLIHTGSKKILDGVCSQLDLRPDSDEGARLLQSAGALRKSIQRLDRFHAGGEERLVRSGDGGRFWSGIYRERRDYEL